MALARLKGETYSETHIEYQAVSGVTTSSETTILSYTNSGTTLKVDAIGGTGTARAELKIYINDTLKLRRRIGVANMNMDVGMYNFRLDNGDKIDIKATHWESANQDFQMEMRYHR